MPEKGTWIRLAGTPTYAIWVFLAWLVLIPGSVILMLVLNGEANVVRVMVALLPSACFLGSFIAHFRCRHGLQVSRDGILWLRCGHWECIGAIDSQFIRWEDILRIGSCVVELPLGRKQVKYSAILIYGLHNSSGLPLHPPLAWADSGIVGK